MKTVSPAAPPPRIVLFGIRCAFTDAVAARLSQRGLTPTALFIPGHPQLERPVRVGVPPSTLPIAGSPAKVPARAYPTYQLGKLKSLSTIETVASFAPDLIVVACFPRLIPRDIRDIPRLAALNIHPALLPAHRGPDPLFWIMRAGGAGFGVTLHELDSQFDTGDILEQRALPYPEGAREPDLEKLLAAAGADLAANFATELAHGTSQKLPQDERAASYQSWPTEDDYAIDTGYSALHAWNFIRGVAGRGLPVRVETDAGPILVSDALASGERNERPVEPGQEQIVISFETGWLLGQLSHDGGS